MSVPTPMTVPKPPATEPPAAAARAQVQQTLAPAAQTKIGVRNLNFYYGRAQALYTISLVVPERVVMAFIGPSGCGKSTFLRTLNRMNDTIPGTRVEGHVEIDGR